jgi:hypothetical protein
MSLNFTVTFQYDSKLDDKLAFIDNVFYLSGYTGACKDCENFNNTWRYNPNNISIGEFVCNIVSMVAQDQSNDLVCTHIQFDLPLVPSFIVSTENKEHIADILGNVKKHLNAIYARMA